MKGFTVSIGSSDSNDRVERLVLAETAHEATLAACRLTGARTWHVAVLDRMPQDPAPTDPELDACIVTPGTEAYL